MKYIHNTHNAPITVNLRDAKGNVTRAVTFMPAKMDKFSDRVLSTGYTALTPEEYENLQENSPTFKHYKDDLKLLVESDELPPEAKTPHEALVDARKDARKLQNQITALQADNDKLKASLYDMTEKYNTLQSASTDEEKIKPLTDQIASLTADRDKLKAALELASKELEAKGDAALRGETSTPEAGDANAGAGKKGGKKEKDFE
jgi:small-conductance mechanosensitive channel